MLVTSGNDEAGHHSNGNQKLRVGGGKYADKYRRFKMTFLGRAQVSLADQQFFLEFLQC